MAVTVLFKPETPDDCGMKNYLRTNAWHLMKQRGLETAQELSDAAGLSYTTSYRVLNIDNYSAGAKALDKLSSYFAVSTDDLRWRDLQQDVRHKRDTVLIKMLDGFQLPPGPLYDRYQWLDDPVALPRSWFLFNVGIDPDKARFAIKRTESNKGEIDIGNIAIIDLDATNVEVWGTGLYAYTYHNINDIKRISLPRTGVVRISGSKESEDVTELEGKELEGLVIHGRVVTKIASSRV